VLPIVLAILAVARCTAAQPAVTVQAPRLELWGSVNAALTGPSGDLVSSYSPPLLLDGEFTSHGAQTVTFGSRPAAGFEGGANLFLSSHAGIQFIVDRDSPEVSGINMPYDVSLQYISRQPPSDFLVPVDIHASIPWPDTTGSLTQTGLSVNGVIRLGQPGRVSLTLSGGLTYYRLSGDVQPIAYTTYHLGGHSVLFGDDYRLAVSLEPTTGIGFNGGGDINVGIHKGVALMMGYRYRGGPAVDVPVRVTSILNPDQIVFQQAIADIIQRLALAPAHVGISGSRVVVGLKWMH
jgi:hypothetical protein